MNKDEELRVAQEAWEPRATAYRPGGLPQDSIEPVSMYEDWYDSNSCSHCGMVGGHVKTCRHYTTSPAAAPVQEPEQEPLSKKWKWVLHESFADVAGFDEEGIPSFYWKESVTKFKSGELSAPCKGKNCGSLNGWLHSAECRAEHEAQYTNPPTAAQRQWVWLSTAEEQEIKSNCTTVACVLKAIKAKLKEKNNG
jgi:hypothetical protein